MRDPLADALVVVERRLLSLERRFRDFAAGSVRYLHQLLDVDITYDGPSAVADGDVLTYDADIERWVNGSGGGGGYSTIRVSGDTSPWSAEDWALASGYGLMYIYSGSVGSGICGGVVVSTPGIYSVEVVTESEDAHTVEALADSVAGGWQFADESSQCRGNPVIIEHAEAGDGGASGAVQMALAGGHLVLVRITTAGYVGWSLSMHLVAPADIVNGSCEA